MTRGWLRAALAGVVLAVAPPSGGDPSQASMLLRSPAFPAGAPIPARFTCDGKGVSPALSWEGAPQRTHSFALLMDDPDAPAGSWVHWLLFDIPAETTGLAEAKAGHTFAGGVRQGRNSWGRSEYGGPCPPYGTHRYLFRLYALDTRLGLPSGAPKGSLLAAMKGHVLARAELRGTYARRTPH